MWQPVIQAACRGNPDRETGEDLPEETGNELLADAYVLAAEEQGMDEDLMAKQDWPTEVWSY